MAIYNDPNPNADLFVRPQAPPPRPPAAPPPRRRGLPPVTALVILILLFGMVGGGAAAIFVLRPDLSLQQQIEESDPFQRTAGYFVGYDEILAITGAGPLVRDAGDSTIDWSGRGRGTARIHLEITGPSGTTEAWTTWSKDPGGWSLTSASFADSGGVQVGIPVGGGSFLSRYDLTAWRAADPTTTLGRGQRELIEGRPVQAIQYLSEVLKSEPHDTEAMLWRGRAFERLGNLPKALADYQRILTYEPEHPAALARLDGLRASPILGEQVAPQPEAAKPPKVQPSPRALIPD